MNTLNSSYASERRVLVPRKASGCERPCGGVKIIPANALDACASSGLWPGGTKPVLRQRLVSNRTAFGDLSYLMAQLIDGGNTEAVVDEIISAWPQDLWELRAYLLSKSPYLSVDALKQVVNKDIPVAVKTEILVANPEATQKEGFLYWAEFEANYPLPEYAIVSVIASWDTKTYRSTLELQMAEKHTALSQAASGLIYLLQTDTVPPPPDSLRWVWQQVRTNGARYAEAALLLGAQRHADARAVIEAMPAEKNLRSPEEQERQRMLTYIDVLAGADHDGRNAYQLNTQEVEALEDMAMDHYDRPSNWAYNLLCAVYKKCRAPWTGGEPAPKSRHYQAGAVPVVAQQGLTVQPNPARTWAAFGYKLPTTAAHANIVVRDLAGRIIHQQRVTGAEGQVLWDSRETGSGSYMVYLEADGAVLGIARLIIQ